MTDLRSTVAITTKIEPERAFYPAEAYHQDFLTRHPSHPSIVINDLPKVESLNRLFPDHDRAAGARFTDRELKGEPGSRP